MAGSVTPAVFLSAPHLEHQKGVRHGGEGDMMVPARPRAPFEVIDAEFVLQFAIVLLNAPPAFGQTHEPPEA